MAQAVAILTRSEDRVQLGPRRQVEVRLLELRSSPGPKTGCSCRGAGPPGRDRRSCDPHPVRRPGAASSARSTWSSRSWLRSSPGPKTGCSAEPGAARLLLRQVAILTRSEDRVQLPRAATTPALPGRLRSSPGPKTGCSPAAGQATRPGRRVAILTRSEDRVQPVYEWTLTAYVDTLRSSPGPKTGCSTPGPARSASGQGCCDPHPVRRPGAALSSHPGVRRRHASCDPHPVRRPGAASVASVQARARRGCDPHPVRRPGAAG